MKRQAQNSRLHFSDILAIIRHEDAEVAFNVDVPTSSTTKRIKQMATTKKAPAKKAAKKASK